MNQKLCDIRTQAASSAIEMVDTEFRLDDQDLDGLSNEHIQQRRRNYAQDLLDDEKFVFGKYSVSQNDIVCFFIFLKH